MTEPPLGSTTRLVNREGSFTLRRSFKRKAGSREHQ